MKVLAGLMIVLALLVGVVPMFTDCASQGSQLTLADGRNIPMKCHWTGKAELAMALPLFVTGSMLVTSRRRETRLNLGIAGAVLGAGVILLPTALIGVCGNPDMICNSIMRPALILMGSLVTVASLAVVVQSLKKDERAEWSLSS